MNPTFISKLLPPKTVIDIPTVISYKIELQLSKYGL